MTLNPGYPMKSFRTLAGLAGLLVALVASADPAFESAYRGTLLKSYDGAEEKFLALAEAIPESDYAWRPMAGVNSVREILVHVTEANLFLLGRLGGKIPAGVDPKALGASMTTKAAAIGVTRQVIGAMHERLATIPLGELTEEIKFFGATTPKMGVAAQAVDHAHEHLGQLIAYARANHVTPPWSK